MDPTHSFSTGGRGLRRLFTMVAPGLQELRISSCSDIFHGKSFADLVGLQQLQVLAVTCITSKLTAEDLAPLEQLKKLKVCADGVRLGSQGGGVEGACIASGAMWRPSMRRMLRCGSASANEGAGGVLLWRYKVCSRPALYYRRYEHWHLA